MAGIELDVAEYFQCLAGTENDLNHLSTFVESEHEIENVCDSRYIELSDITSIIKDDVKDFTILTLNIQSINAKVDNFYPVINNLSSMGLYFGAICLQETWLSSDADVSLLHIPGYKLIHQGSRCTRHGGLVIYLHEQYTYKLRNMYTRSDIWEGLFIDVLGHNLHQPITIGNIYRPPHNNNNNANIETFIEEMSPIINFFRKITLPTRSSKRSCTLIDQMFCKLPHLDHANISSAIIMKHFRPLPVLGKTRNSKG